MKEKETNAPSIHEQIGTAERALHELEVEREQLPGLIQSAARDADAEALVKHRRRLDEIDLFVNSARVRLIRLRITAREIQLPDLEAELHRASELASKELATFEAVRLRKDQSRNYMEACNQSARDCRQEVADLGRELSRVMQSVAVTPTAPIVRSLPHAPQLKSA